MKKIILAFSLLFSVLFLNAQTDTSAVNATTSQIKIGKHTISANTTVAELISSFGTPSRIEQSAGKDRHYIYDALGLAFDCRPGTVDGVYFTFHTDGDKKTANAAIKGTLLIDNYTITDHTTADQIKANTSIKAIMCLGDLMCMSDPKQAGVALILGYTKDKLITQVCIGLKKM